MPAVLGLWHFAVLVAMVTAVLVQFDADAHHTCEVDENEAFDPVRDGAVGDVVQVQHEDGQDHGERRDGHGARQVDT